MTPDTVANEKTASKVVLFEYILFSMAYFLFLGTNALYLSRYKAYDATTVGLLLLISAIAAKASRIALAGALDKISAKWLSITCALVTCLWVHFTWFDKHPEPDWREFDRNWTNWNKTSTLRLA